VPEIWRGEASHVKRMTAAGAVHDGQGRGSNGAVPVAQDLRYIGVPRLICDVFWSCKSHLSQLSGGFAQILLKPRFSVRSGRAPHESNSSTIPACPLAAAKCSGAVEKLGKVRGQEIGINGLEPDVPTEGALEGRLSLL
jgi:hypothetical protein